MVDEAEPESPSAERLLSSSVKCGSEVLEKHLGKRGHAEYIVVYVVSYVLLNLLIFS